MSQDFLAALTPKADNSPAKQISQPKRLEDSIAEKGFQAYVDEMQHEAIEKRARQRVIARLGESATQADIQEEITRIIEEDIKREIEEEQRKLEQAIKEKSEAI